MPKCKVNYEESEVRDYNAEGADAGHKYLRLVLNDASLNWAQRALLGANEAMTILLYPQRKADNTINEVFEKGMIEAFDKKQLGDIYADRIAVEVPPTIMTYSNTTRNHNAGDIVMDDDKPRIVTTVNLATLTKIKDGKEIPVLSESQLHSRAMAIRDYRIQQGQWMAASDYQPDVDEVDDFNNVDDAEYAEVVDAPQNPTPTPQQPRVAARPARPGAQR